MEIFPCFLCLCMVIATLCLPISCGKNDNFVSPEEETEITELDKPFIQAGGHKATIKAGKDKGTINKIYDSQEEDCYKILMENGEKLKPFVPKYKGNVVHKSERDDKEKYLVLENLQSAFTNPSAMDCKIGTRTFHEHETENRLFRADLYKFLSKAMGDHKDLVENLFKDAQFLKEAEDKKGVINITKRKCWDLISTSFKYGIRVIGFTKPGIDHTITFPIYGSMNAVKNAIEEFVTGHDHAIPKYLRRLKDLKAAMLESNFFKAHEMIGSSLYFVHDTDKASIWMIDFARTIRLPEGKIINHFSPWEMGNHEDGYLTGMETLINIFEELNQKRLHTKTSGTMSVTTKIADRILNGIFHVA